MQITSLDLRLYNDCLTKLCKILPSFSLRCENESYFCCRVAGGGAGKLQPVRLLQYPLTKANATKNNFLAVLVNKFFALHSQAL